MWQIIPQEVKDGYVDVKQVRFFPIKDRKTKEVVGFGRLGMCLRLKFRHELNKDYEEWTITFTKHGYNITCPKRLVPKEKDRWSKEMVLVPGRAFGGNATSGSMSESKFRRELMTMCGADFTETVLSAFEVAKAT